MIKEYLGQSTREDISNAELKYDIVFPDDYTDFLMNFNGAIAGVDANAELVSTEEYIDIDSLFGLHCKKDFLDFEHWMSKYGDEIPPDFVIIGRDILGGFIILGCSEEHAGVYYWDSAFNFKTSNANRNVYSVAESFTEFFEKLRN